MINRIIAKLFGWHVTLIAAGLSSLLWVGTIYGGKIEGRIFPVVGGTNITRMEIVDATSTRIWGGAVKLRNCSFQRIDWHFGTTSANAFVDVLIEEKTKLRADGTFGFGPWIIRLTPDEVQYRSFATVYHKCHSFWLTETRFYP